jgi:endonuclease YncB( thermonuclease family)
VSTDDGEWQVKRRRPGLTELALTVAMRSLSTGAAASDINEYAIVIDGDTLLIRTVSIRLTGIDAPELGQKCKRPDDVEWDCGLDAKRVLAEKIGNEPVSCRQLYIDLYDRIFARCRASNGDDLSAIMVLEGRSRRWPRWTISC